jgi:rare lipoprotein A (peptidoglycan hydrolase)
MAEETNGLRDRPTMPISRRPGHLAVAVACLLAAMATVAVPAYPAEEPDSVQNLASYYGHQFDGQPTASGETFDMLGMTAAHRSLPFGTRVRVTNLTNGRSATVRINDRGPFVKGRVLDLSYAAAERLRMVGSGVEPVRMVVLPRLATTAMPDYRLARRLARRPCRCRGEAIVASFHTARIDVLRSS